MAATRKKASMSQRQILNLKKTYLNFNCNRGN